MLFRSGVIILEPGNEYTRDDGSIGVSYNAKKVFDISQTTAKQKEAANVSLDSRLLIKALINNAPCEITISENLPKDVGSMYQPEEQVILVRQGMNSDDIFRSLSQELVHAHMDKGEYNRNDCAFTAYCASYMLCKRNGIAVDTFSFDRLPESYRTMEPQEVRSKLSKIRDVANDISADMARVLEPQEIG